MQPSEVTFFLADQVYKKMRSLCFSTEEVNQQNNIVTKLVTFHMVNGHPQPLFYSDTWPRGQSGERGLPGIRAGYWGGFL